MKKILALALTAILLCSLCACGAKKPGSFPAETAVTVLPDTITMEEGGEWPQNDYTDRIPQPVGTVLWSMTDSAKDTFGIAVTGIAKREMDNYMDRLKAMGFLEVEQTEPAPDSSRRLSFGTLFSDGKRTISLSYANPVLMLSIRNTGLKAEKKSLFSASNLANIYQNSYATYDETTGIGLAVELYVPDEKKSNPEFTGITGVAVITLQDGQHLQYFELTPDNRNAIAAMMTTGVTGQSGEAGTVILAGTAYAEDALAGGGAFAIAYNIAIP